MKASSKDGTDVKEDIEVAILFNVIGEEGLRVFNSLNLNSGTINLADLLKEFENYWKPRANIVYGEFVFRNIIQEGQAFDNYLTELNNSISKCVFGDQESNIIRDQVIFGIRDLHVKKVLLRGENITLEKVSEYFRAVEVSKQQKEEFQREASVNINVV
ncbi:hypothetical protein JTB14_001304 [Gonioctena quinquepunctata]|nr:hypothetical protein JTB14_001304 [Gonioctena quinquepunctata]